MIIGYSKEAGTEQLIRNALAKAQTPKIQDDSGSCDIKATLPCEADQHIDFLGYRLSLDELGLTLFTLAMGLLDGFNPCSLWVLMLMISLLASMNDRMRMLHHRRYFRGRGRPGLFHFHGGLAQPVPADRPVAFLGNRHSIHCLAGRAD